ncbi:MAG: TonB-dependent receptor [Deltaproteobacteria bacterium]|nr:TonB-dependent receptor [Deltaproteobacteria bacterium]
MILRVWLGLLMRSGALLAASLCWPLAAAAQSEAADSDTVSERAREPVGDYEEIVVTGSLAPRTQSLTPGSVTVIGVEEIAATRAQSVNELLRHVAGLHLEQQGARGGRASLYLRGLDPNHVVVLVDGVKLNDPTNQRGGAFDPSSLAVLDIERIEIVRGPLSAVWGSDALAGAINVITRRAKPGDEAEYVLAAEAGRFETGRVLGRASGSLGPVGASIAGSWENEADPYSSGGYRGGNLKTTLDIDLPAETRLRADLRFADTTSEAYQEFSGGPLFSATNELELRDAWELSVGASLEHTLGESIGLTLEAQHARRNEDRHSPGIPASPLDPFNFVPEEIARDQMHRTFFAARADTSILQGLSFTLGFDGLWESGRSDALLDLLDFGVWIPALYALDRRIFGLFGEGTYEFDWGLSLSASVRGDWPEDHSGVFSPAVGGTLEIPRTSIQLHGSWSRGYKLPSFYALGNPLIGNPDLLPERSQGWELGLRWETPSLQAGLTYFDVGVEDLIDFEISCFCLLNRDRVLSRGIELDIGVRPIETLELGGGVTYNPTDILGTDQELRIRPRWRGSLRLLWDATPKLQLATRVLFVGTVYDASIPTGPSLLPLDDYVRLDLSATWSAHDHLKIFVAVDNLLNARYQEAMGFLAIGMRPRVGLELRL